MTDEELLKALGLTKKSCISEQIVQTLHHWLEACDKIADLEKENEKLKKENAELKTNYEVLSCSVDDFDELQNRLEEEQRKNNGLSDNLAKAKELLSKLSQLKHRADDPFTCDEYLKLILETEMFLKEVSE